jgi:hypothetical protein
LDRGFSHDRKTQSNKIRSIIDAGLDVDSGKLDENKRFWAAVIIDIPKFVGASD